MEHVVDLSCFWKIELIYNWEEDFDNGERSFSFTIGVNLELMMEYLRFLTSSQTLSPLKKGVNPQLLWEDVV